MSFFTEEAAGMGKSKRLAGARPGRGPGNNTVSIAEGRDRDLFQIG